MLDVFLLFRYDVNRLSLCKEEDMKIMLAVVAVVFLLGGYEKWNWVLALVGVVFAVVFLIALWRSPERSRHAAFEVDYVPHDKQ